MPTEARMLVLPRPPTSLPLGDPARPTRGAKLLCLTGARLLGMPGSPGNTHPVGEPGNTLDCRPGTRVSSCLCASYHGEVTYQRDPSFNVRMGLMGLLYCGYRV